MLITLYGIPNCDTVKKAKLWLTAQRLEFVFHDFKKQGLQRATVTQWLTQLSPDVLVNRKGTTWRKLPKEQTENADEGSARALMLEHPTLIKRPVFDLGKSGKNDIVIGFKPAEQEKIRAALS